MADFSLKVGDRRPSITATLTQGGVALNLTTASSVAFVMTPIYGPQTAKVNAAATIVDAATGAVRYDWLAADVDTVGSYLAKWVVTWNDGRVSSYPDVGALTIVIS